MTTYSNPRMSATVENWPSGKHRVTAHFLIEVDPKRGERATAPKKLTYARRVKIVDGDDERIYILDLERELPLITIMSGTMDYQEESLTERDPRWTELLDLFTELLAMFEGR